MNRESPQPNDFDPEREHQNWDFSLNLNYTSPDQKILALQQRYLDLAASRGQYGIESSALRTEVLALLLNSLHLIPTAVTSAAAENKKEPVQPIFLSGCQKKGHAASALLRLQVDNSSRTLAPLEAITKDSVLDSLNFFKHSLGEARGRVYQEPVGLVLSALNQPKAEIVLGETAIEEDLEYARDNTLEIRNSIEAFGIKAHRGKEPYLVSPVTSSISCAMALAQARRDLYAHVITCSEESFFILGVADFEGPIGATRNSCRFKIDTILLSANTGLDTSGIIQVFQTFRFSDHVRWTVEPTGLAKTECLETNITRLSA
jgi:hypothetical protein